MKKGTILLIAALLCAAMSMVALTGCGGGGGGDKAATEATEATEAADTAATEAADAGAAAAGATSQGALLTVDGADLNDLSVDMVGDTPNLMMIFANNTDQDVTFDLSPIKVLVDDKDEVSFHLTSKTIEANTPYLQCADTASPGSMKVGDQAYVYYGDTLLGVFEVTEF